VHLQRRILVNTWPILAQGGLIVYATCSLLKEENETQIASFLRDHPDAREAPIEAGWGSPRQHGRQILSGEDGMDGFYYACLTKCH
jgi:16S rRNA (cytosine967-C5)-methyltransferase